MAFETYFSEATVEQEMQLYDKYKNLIRIESGKRSWLVSSGSEIGYEQDGKTYIRKDLVLVKG